MYPDPAHPTSQGSELAQISLAPIATLIGGRTEVADDCWGGVQSIIRLNGDLLLDT